MKINALFILICSCFSLFGSIKKSIVPSMNFLIIKELNEKVSVDQINDMQSFFQLFDQRIRIMSFNMLLNYSESHLDVVDHWENRKERVISYIQYAHPDVIGSQELQSDQLDDILCAIGDEYHYYGLGTKDGIKEGDIPAIFYCKNRLELVKGQTFYFSETPYKISNGPFGKKNTFTLCQFRDKKTDHQFIILNTHFSFGNVEQRHYEACKLREFLLGNRFELPLLITGDFNTFPFRQELDLPFYDGDKIIGVIEEGGVIDSLKTSLFGHFGPISSTNFCAKEKKPFCSEGDPGIILDHIFVNKRIRVLSHGIDPAKVDGHFPSDHFPVIADIVIS